MKQTIIYGGTFGQVLIEYNETTGEYNAQLLKTTLNGVSDIVGYGDRKKSALIDLYINICRSAAIKDFDINE